MELRCRSIFLIRWTSSVYAGCVSTSTSLSVAFWPSKGFFNAERNLFSLLLNIFGDLQGHMPSKILTKRPWPWERDKPRGWQWSEISELEELKDQVDQFVKWKASRCYESWRPRWIFFLEKGVPWWLLHDGLECACDICWVKVGKLNLSDSIFVF